MERDELDESLDDELGDMLDEETLDESLYWLPEFDETGVDGRFSDLINGLNIFFFFCCRKCQRQWYSNLSSQINGILSFWLLIL